MLYHTNGVVFYIHHRTPDDGVTTKSSCKHVKRTLQEARNDCVRRFAHPLPPSEHNTYPMGVNHFNFTKVLLVYSFQFVGKNRQSFWRTDVTRHLSRVLVPFYIYPYRKTKFHVFPFFSNLQSATSIHQRHTHFPHWELTKNRCSTISAEFVDAN